MKKVFIVSAVLILTIILAVIFRHRNSPPAYRTAASITRGEIETTVTAFGTVNPISTVRVGTQVSGRIKQIYVDFNSHVKKGQLIALIDPTTFETRVEQAKANLLAAQAGMARAKANLLEAKRTMERNRKLLSGNLISRSDMDTSETKYEIAKTAVATAGAQIVQAKAGLQYAETNLKYTRILSPVKGIVISRNVDVGQTVAASFQTPTLFSIAGNLAKMQIDTNVDEADIGNIKVGEDVAFTVEAYPNLKFKGRVWQVRNAPIVIQNVVTYDAVIRVNNPGLKLKPGMTASVSITTLRKKNVLRIPNAALRFVPDGENAGRTRQEEYGVWIIEKKKLKRITVKIGISDANYTELLSGNLKAGQKVMVESLTEQHKSGRGIF